MSKSYQYVETKNPDIFRVVDRNNKCQWYWRKSSDQYFNSVDRLLAEGYKEADLVDYAMEEDVEILQNSIEDILSSTKNEINISQAGSETGLQHWDSMVGFARFWEDHAPIILASSATLFNSMFKYAGEAHAIIILTKECGNDACPCHNLIGKVGLYRWQTDEPHPSDVARLCALAVAENLGEYLPPSEGLGYTSVLTISGGESAVSAYKISNYTQDDLAEAWPRFVGAVRIFEFVTTPFDPDKDIFDIPNTISFKIKRFDFAKAKKEAAKLAAVPAHISKVKSLDIDLNLLKIGAWIIIGSGSLAEVTQLDDNGTVHYLTESKEPGSIHYTGIREVYEKNPKSNEPEKSKKKAKKK